MLFSFFSFFACIGVLMIFKGQDIQNWLQQKDSELKIKQKKNFIEETP